MSEQSFTTSYTKLNVEQKKAVDTIEGPVMVVAGPGTGKTQILTLRIANILKETDTSPDSILALTFTESGVSAMRKRLVSMIGSRGYRVNIHTFHGFCNMVIGRFPNDFPRLISSDAITDIDKVLLMRDIITNHEGLEHLRPFYDNFAYVKECISAISELKREYISPDDFKHLIETSEKEFWARDDLYNEKGAYKGKMKTEHQKTHKRIERNKELAGVYEHYETLMHERKLYDYEDMIGVVVRRLEEERDVLQRLQEEYHYILADEHQDANTAQNRLLELLMDFYDNPNLFIVGDEKQAIFRFQGASLENFLYFKKKYPNALLVELKDSYRSGQKILDSAHSVIVNSEEDVKRVSLKASKDVRNESVELRVFSSDALEALFVARDIKTKIDEEVDPREIAVLYRTNSDATYISQALERELITYTVESKRNVLDDPAIVQFLLLLRVVSNIGDEVSLARLLHARFLGFSSLDIFKILKYTARNPVEIYDTLHNEKLLKKIGVSNSKAFFVFAKRLSKWSEAGYNDPVTDVFNTILDESGFLTSLLNSVRSVEMIEKLSGLSRDIEQLATGNREYTLKDLVHHLDLLNEYQIRIVKQEHTHTKHSGVRLMTAHGSKGLEFEYVYMIGAWDTHWGNRRDMSFFSLPFGGGGTQDNADERRLFYVALTRAKTGVFMSYARLSLSGKERLPSQFIEEMDRKLLKEVRVDSFESEITPETFLQKTPEGVHLSVDNVTYLRELFVEQGLSVTALNNYLSCPWKFFYNNLIRIPKIQDKYAILGIAVHKALASFFGDLSHGGGSLEILLTAFEEALKRTTLSGRTYNEIYEKGKRALEGWYDVHKDNWHRETKNEYKIDTFLELPLKELPQLRIRGSLDKLDIYPDGVCVIDYKTGKPKSRNTLLGKTKARGAGDYFRQLIFYKMLLDREGVYTMKEGVVDFIEPKESGAYVSEKFEITPHDVESLLSEVARVAEEIITFSFWEKTCGEKECEYCALRALMG